ncbi:hypothetical protein ONZ45_g15023 [Pleurotus djamor]|nr:hypothetical protein ONZ45_g15023 [Pleurotus djamor]
MTADVIDLVSSDEPIIIPSGSDDAKELPSPKPRKRPRRNPKPSSSRLQPQSSSSSIQRVDDEKDALDNDEPPTTKGQQTDATDPLFFVDVTPIVLQPALKHVEAAPGKPSGTENKLLLPAHVAVGESETIDSELEEGEESFIEYVDYDDNRKSGLVRYFEEEEKEEPQPVKRNCPNRGDYSNYGCERCGSDIHKTSDCPTLWRQYSYVSDEGRQEILQVRESKYDLEIGEGGEGYIGTDIWCYNCGDDGHWGDDCTIERKAHRPPDEPSAFSEHNTSIGPFSEATIEPSTSRPRKAQPWTESDYVDPKLPGNVGKEGRKKSKAKMEKRAREVEEEDEEEDWFAQGSRRRTVTAGSSKPAKPKSADRKRDKSGGSGESHGGKTIKFKMGPIRQDVGNKAESSKPQSLLDRLHGPGLTNPRNGLKPTKPESYGQSSSKPRYDKDRDRRDRDRDRDRDRRRDRDEEDRRSQSYIATILRREPPSEDRYGRILKTSDADALMEA